MAPQHDLREMGELALRIAKRYLRREGYLPVTAEMIANQAMASLADRIETEDVANPAGFLTWKIKRLVIDAGLARKVEVNKMVLFNVEVPRYQKNFSGGGEMELLPRDDQFRGLSLPIINDEESEAVNLKAAAIIASMPDPDDRELLTSRFYGFDLSITDLARMHGNKSPNAMANYLKKILGTPEEPGAVKCVGLVMDRLSLTTGRAFTRILANYDELDRLSDPIGAAIGHLEFMGTQSSGHRKLAAKGIARLQWMARHRPSNRGLPNKLLNRLITAGCFYVIEVRDARHDEYDEFGLVDDIKVLDAIYQAISKTAAA